MEEYERSYQGHCNLTKSTMPIVKGRRWVAVSAGSWHACAIDGAAGLCLPVSLSFSVFRYAELCLCLSCLRRGRLVVLGQQQLRPERRASVLMRTLLCSRAGVAVCGFLTADMPDYTTDEGTQMWAAIYHGFPASDQ